MRTWRSRYDCPNQKAIRVQAHSGGISFIIEWRSGSSCRLRRKSEEVGIEDRMSSYSVGIEVKHESSWCIRVKVNQETGGIEHGTWSGASSSSGPVSAICTSMPIRLPFYLLSNCARKNLSRASYRGSKRAAFDVGTREEPVLCACSIVALPWKTENTKMPSEGRQVSEHFIHSLFTVNTYQSAPLLDVLVEKGPAVLTSASLPVECQNVTWLLEKLISYATLCHSSALSSTFHLL